MFKRSFFIPLGQVDTKKWALVVGTIAVFWMGLNSIVPEMYYHRVSVVISALQSALLFIMRGGSPTTVRQEDKENK